MLLDLAFEIRFAEHCLFGLFVGSQNFLAPDINCQMS